MNTTTIMLVEGCPKCATEVIEDKKININIRTFQHEFHCDSCNTKWSEQYKILDDGTLSPSYLWGD